MHLKGCWLSKDVMVEWSRVMLFTTRYLFMYFVLCRFAGRVAPRLTTTIISNTVYHDCIETAPAPTHAWNHIQNPERLRIPHPSKVQETTRLPSPHCLSISHKLRVIIRFDQSLSKERDLQLSFPVIVHPVMTEDGAPVHPDPNYDHVRQRRRRRQALYGNRTVAGEGYGEDGEGYDDDDVLPLPIYADREATVLLMVGEEIIEQPLDLQAEEVEAMGVRQRAAYDPRSSSDSSSNSSSIENDSNADEQNMSMHSPVETLQLSSPPLSPVSSILSRTHFFDQRWVPSPSDETPDYSAAAEHGQIPSILPPPYGFRSHHISSVEYSTTPA